MEDVNRALVAKRGWEMMVNRDNLWVQALSAKYCPNSSLLKARVSSGTSWAWQSMMSSRDLVEAGYCWQINSGRDVNIWCEPWVPGIEGFTPKLKWGTTVNRNLNRVSDLIDSTCYRWKAELIGEIFEDSSTAAILNIQLTNSDYLDLPRWILEAKGLDTVKEAYLYDQQFRFQQTGDLSQSEWKKIWSLKIQHCLKLL